MGIMIGSKYKLVTHPHQPVGTAKSWNHQKEILVEWDDKALIPPSDYYSEDLFANGSFQLVPHDTFEGMYGYLGDYGHSTECAHDWTTYTGLREEYEFCKKCDRKR